MILRFLAWLFFPKRTLKSKPEPTMVLPMPILADGRVPKITSSSKWNNKSRPTHQGSDYMYRRLSTDPEMPTGDGGRTTNGRWWVPPGTPAVAVKAGIVRKKQFGWISTGFRCYVEHSDGHRTGYFHLSKLLVEPGQTVSVGQPLGIVGHNPKAHDPVHLHFEVFKGNSRVNPEKYMEEVLS